MELNIPLLRSSFEIAKPVAGDVISHFYKTLFETYPASKELFSQVDFEKQKKNLSASLTLIIDNLDHRDTLIPYLRKLGARHAQYGAEEPHYAMVGKCLLATFRHFLGGHWTPELEEQWILAIGLIADQMLEGAKADRATSRPVLKIVEPTSPNSIKSDPADVTQMVRQIARNLLFKALEDEMDGEFMKAVRKKASGILTQALRDEADKIQDQLLGRKKAS